MDKENIKNRIQGLVDKYESARRAGKIRGYTEQETKKDFIEPHHR
ncbi:MAG: hypothetical protein V1656_01210 [Candidatus Jorgensenbacteria bacterium]